jgi:cell division protein FtsQ
MELAEKKYSKIVADRKRRLIRRKIGIFFRIFFLVIFLIGLVWGFNYFYNSGYFKISSITVQNNSHYSEETIKKETNITFGSNIFEIDKKVIEERLLKKLIWLKGVTLKKIFPGKIVIDTVERNPFVKIMAAGNYFVMDDEGIILEELDVKENDKYPDLILVKNAIKYNPGIGEKIAKKNILSCGEIYRSLDIEVKKEIKEAMIDNNFTEDIIFLTYNNKKVIFGDNSNIIEKNSILKKIMKQLSEENAYYNIIDLSNIENPVIE